MKEHDATIKMPVYGSLAYDFETAVSLPDLSPKYREQEQQVVIPAPPQAEEQSRTKAQIRVKQTVSPLAIIGFACAAVLLVFTLMSHIQLTVMTDEAAALESRLEELSLAQARLLIEHESVFNRTEIEEYAVSVLGMQRPREEQVIYLNSTAPDKAVILRSAGETMGFFERVSKIFGDIAEYFE